MAAERRLLFERARHEPLAGGSWDAARVREAVRAIVADLEQALREDASWPWHPLDAEASSEPPPKTLYLGAAGVLWAMAHLRRAGAVTLAVEPATLIERVDAAYRAQPDTGAVVPSYFVGEAGILLVCWRLTRTREAADRLHAAIAANLDNPSNEALWAAPGTMLGALHMLRWTGERRWHDLYLANVEQLWRTWQWSGHARCHLWTQDLYGRTSQYLGAAHGFAGNAYALLHGAALLPVERREALYARCAETLRTTAIVEGNGANWPPSVEPARSGPTKMLLQWCHGAPGIVTSFADFPPRRSPDVDALLVAAGHAIWRAGPLAKGSGLCHGTAGNGCAFLALHARTGEAIWLERARAFAMHAIVQSERAKQRYGQPRCTLWTGDAGLAVFLWQCVSGERGVPGLDVLE